MADDLKYGYKGAEPTQSQSANTGVFSTDDINELIQAKQWVSVGNLELIETQILNDPTYSTKFVRFENLGNYNVHFVTFTNVLNNGYFPLGIQVQTSTGWKTGSNYQYALQTYQDTGLLVDSSTGYTSCKLNSSAYRGVNGYAWIYNAIDSSKFTSFTSHTSSVRGNNLGIEGNWGMSWYQSAEAVTGIQFVYEGVLYAMGGFGQYSLYGLRGA